MKITKRVLSIVMAIITLVSVMGIAVEAASVTVNELNLGYMAPTNSKATKLLSTVKLYGDYDYINFYIDSKKNNSYFAYVITTDKEGEDVVATNAILCDKGTYTYTEKIRLKGDYVSGTYYIFTYAMKSYSDDSIKIDQNSLCQFKLIVKRTAAFDDKIVVLKEAKNTTKGVCVSWSKLSGASKYYIYRRSLMGTKWTKVGAVGSSKTSFTDTTAKNTGKYVYSVKGINKNGVSSRYLYFGPETIFAKAPIMKSIAVTYDNAIEIKWKGTSSKAKYTIMRKADDGNWKIIEKNYSGTSYKDISVKNGIKYTYTVKAIIPTDYGKAISAYYYNSDKAVTYLAAPTLTGITPVEKGMTITWSAVKGSTGYTILRKNSDGTTGWSSIGKVGADVRAFTDKTALSDVDYTYTVRSEASKNKGSYDRSGIEYIQLDAPVLKIKIDEEFNSPILIWSSVKNATHYQVFRRTADGEWFMDSDDNHTCAFSRDWPNVEYMEFRVRATRDNKNFSEYSNTVYYNFKENKIIYPD